MTGSTIRPRARWIAVAAIVLTAVPMTVLASPVSAPVSLPAVPDLVSGHITVNFAEAARKPAAPQDVLMAADRDAETHKIPHGNRVAFPGVPTNPAPAEPPAQDHGIPVQSGATVASSFRAVDDNIAVIPPDTDGAVGPNHVFTALNNLLVVQNRTGTTLSSVSPSTFWGTLQTTGVTDPRTYYDPYGGRFVMTAIGDPGATTSTHLIAASQTNDPTGTWNAYSVRTDTTGATIVDFIGLGFNAQWVVVSSNLFNRTTGAFQGSKIRVLDKAALYAGTLSSVPTYTLTTQCGGVLGGCGELQAPAATYDSTLNTMYLINPWDETGAGTVMLWTMTGTVAAPSLAQTAAVAFGSTWDYCVDTTCTASLDFAPQLGAANKINTGTDTIGQVVYRGGSIYTSHVAYLPATGTATRTAVQWWKISTAGVKQDGGRVDDATATSFYYYPSIAVNKNNDILVGYSRSSASEYVSAAWSYHDHTDVAGSMQASQTLKAGEAKYFKTYSGTRNRWGDYSSTVVDPANDTDMWTLQEFAWTPGGSPTVYDRWSTWWGKISTASAGAVGLSASSLAYGNQRVGTTSAAQSVTVTNTGTGTLTVGTATLTGTNASNFAKSADTCSGQSVAPLGTCSISVTFTPSATGARSATLSIPSNAPTSPNTVALTGTGIQPAISLSPTSLSFGNQRVNTTSTAQTITVTNTGTDTLNITSANASGDFAVSSSTCTSVAPAGTCSVSVRFTPTTTGARSGTVTIVSDAPTSPSTAALSGTGIAPAVALSPTSVSFGNQRVGTTSAPVTVTLTNSGTDSLNVASIGFAGDFAAASDTCTGATVAPAGTCSVGVRFSPAAVGSRSGTLTITSDAPSSPSTVPLSGSGIQPATTLSAPSLSFGNQRVGTTSSAHTVTVTNTGTDTLNVSAVTIGGLNASNFVVSADSCSGAAVVASASCSVSVRFTPSAGGVRSASLSITSDAPSSPDSVALSGTGVRPGVGLSSSSVDFGSQQVGTTSGVRTVTVTNTGDDTLNVSSVTLGGVNPGEFGIASDGCSGANVSPAGSCSVDVAFSPTATGARSALLSIASDAGSSPDTVALTGVGTQAAVGVSPGTLSFGNQRVGTTSGTRTLTVSNSGTAPLVVASVALLGPEAADYAIAGDTCSAATVSPGGACTVDVTFSPSSLGTRAAAVTIASNAPTSPDIIPITGTGVLPAASVAPASVGFGDRVVGQPAVSRSVNVTNNGTDTLNISAVAITGSTDFAIGSNGCAGAALAPSDACTVTVTFAATSIGDIAGTLRITSDDPASPAIVPLTGRGIEAQVGLSPASLSFGVVKTGSSSSQQSIAVSNLGSATLAVGTVAITGANPGDFSLASDGCSGASLSPGGICVIGVTFGPTASGARAAQIVVPSNTPTSPTLVPLSGTGDGVAPSSAITTTSLVLLHLLGDRLAGTTTDDIAGVASLTVEYTPLLPLTTTVTVAGTLTCSSATSCSWSAPLPPLPGLYVARAFATDSVGNVENPGPTQTVIVV